MTNHVYAIIIIKQPVGAAPRGRPLINMELRLNNISNKNRISDSGPAQGPAPTGLSLSDIIYRFKSLTTKKYIAAVKKTTNGRHLIKNYRWISKYTGNSGDKRG